jgi:uncharacterized protein with NRDE domain
MCLLVFAWKAHPRYRLVMAANRDEFHDRPAAALGAWQDEPGILAGRDLRSGGTWMGAARPGRYAVVTNFRELEQPAAGAPSRGALVRGFLAGTDAPAEYCSGLSRTAADYAGFNLLAGDIETLHYYSNRNGQSSRLLEAGVFGLSNHWLDSPWPKLLRSRARLAGLIAADRLAPDSLFDLLADREPADLDEMPDTGLPPDWERALSSPFVVHDRYGTRCSTVLLIEHGGHASLLERRFDARGALTGASRVAFQGAAAAA